mmetsp:Transcript_9580/g.11848  ORF Transcript_9580/g.11848 Transcript_9580/m.11848 type:complete len:1772 (-) Transcript_9580:280-5595(-)
MQSNNHCPAPGSINQAPQHQQQTMNVQQQLAAQQQQLLQQQAEMQARQKQQQQFLQQQQVQQMQQVNMSQQQVQQQQTHVPHQGLNGGWQSDKDVNDRRKMIAKIVQLLRQRKPNAPQEWLRRLPGMAKRLEESLYRSAPSFDAYNDFNTLKQRLQQLAMNIGMNKTKKMQERQAQAQAQAQTQLAQQAAAQQTQQQMQQHFQNQQTQQLLQRQQQQAAVQQQGAAQQQQQQQLNNMNGMATMQPLQPQQTQILQQPQMQVPLQPQPQQAPRTTLVNISEINPIMGNTSRAPQTVVKQSSVTPQSNSTIPDSGLPQVAPPGNFGPGSSLGGLANAFSDNVGQVSQPAGSLAGLNNPSLGNQQNNTGQQRSGTSNTGQQQSSSTGLNGAGSGSGNSRQGTDRQQVLRHQQQRLLLLRHAAKCPHEDGRCPVTPHCAGMKRLWKHIAECKDQKCLVPHCVSSRYVLSHYHRCKDVTCPVCGPVRQAIHRSHEKAKQQQMQALKKRHEQALQQNQLPTAPTPAPTQMQHQSQLTQQAVQMQAQTQTQQQQQTHHSLPQLQTQMQQRSQHVQPEHLQPKNVMNVAGGAAPMPSHPHQPLNAMPNAANTASVTTDTQKATKRRKTSSTAKKDKNSTMPSMPPATALPSQQQTHAQQTTQQSQNFICQQQGQQAQAPSSQTSQVNTNQGITLAPNQFNTTAGYNFTPNNAQAPVHSSSNAAATPTPPTPAAAPSSQNNKPAASKPQENHSLLNCFSIEQIETHIASLNKGLQLSPNKLKTKCLEVLKVLQSHQHGWVFNTPVDPVELGLPDYFLVIKHPMDLGTIKKKLENGNYHTLEEFEAHVHLTFDNAMLYNQEGSVVHNMAKEMKVKFVSDFDQLKIQLNAEEDQKRQNGDACPLCGCEKLLFEPPVFYCNGLNCPSKRIRRNSHYYVGGNNQYHWCHHCYGELKDVQVIDMMDVSIKKENLIKKKNDEVHEESWVLCDVCEKWFHQICGLFNTRQNKDQGSEYTCPQCTIDERKKRGITDGTGVTPMAEDLPRTLLSEWLEEHVRKKATVWYDQITKEKAEADGVSFEEAKKAINFGGPITIRQVTSMDRKLEVRERMKRRYAFKDYPHEFTFRCKCIIVFQNLDGVDVILFGLYVYEHDEKNPAPNKRAVYVSYLDSVHYMRPRRMRTFVYHEILIAYLDYVRKKGFATAHIWACPPLKGDDYILYCKPEDQKTPKDDRLRQWYIDMLVECQRRGVVGKMTNMYDLYFANEKNDATCVPYMDGDYFPAEVENIIKDIEEGKNSKKASSSNKKKSKKGDKNKVKTKSGRGGTRSTGIDEEAFAASGIVPPGVETKSLQEGGRDYVMAKLGETIHPMKESFIVAYLAWDQAKAKDMEVPKEIAEYREKHGIKAFMGIPSDDPDNDSKDKSSDANDPSNPDAATDKSNGGTVPDAHTSTSDANGAADNGGASGSGDSQNNESSTGNEESVDASNGAAAPDNATSNTGVGDETPKPSFRDGKLTAMARKRDAEGKSKPESTRSSSSNNGPTRSLITKDRHGRTVKVVDDDMEEVECEFLNNRQAFLNLCQGNHYQFDQLRRAKHTSMMVLWHLHNRDAPKFVQQCAHCSREILSGYRFHCPVCADYDECQDCYNNKKLQRHPHQLKPIAVASGQQSDLTESQRKERQRSIQLHMQLLLHAATCVSPKCPSANCTKMKGLLKHGAACNVKATGGCHVCKRIWALLQIHARQCKQATCPVPNCMAIRERFRQLTKQQQAMDDRRRQEMNRAYRGAAR